MRRSWSALILAILLALIGLILTLGGAWLLSLGGSAYYVIAGLAMLASAWFLRSGTIGSHFIQGPTPFGVAAAPSIALRTASGRPRRAMGASA